MSLQFNKWAKVLSLSVSLLVFQSGGFCVTPMAHAAASGASSGKAGGHDQAFSSAESICKKSNAKDGTPVVQALLEKFRDLNGYCFESVLTTYDDRKPLTETGRFYFKNPNLIRFEVKNAGMRSGAVVVRQADGKIQGKMSWGPRMRLSPKSKLLMTGNGFSIVDSDLETLLQNVYGRIKSSLQCLIVSAGAGKSEVIETLENDGDVVDRILLDAQSKVPLEWGIFRDNKLFSVVKFVNLTPRNDLADSLFNLGSDDDAKGLEGDELLASDLQKLKSSRSLQGMSVGAFGDTSKILAALNQDMIDLRSVIPAQAEESKKASVWDDGVRSRLLAGSIHAELLFTNLDPVSAALACMGGDGEELSKNWDRTASEFKKSNSRLIELIASDSPSYADLSDACRDMSKSLESLQTYANKGLDLL